VNAASDNLESSKSTTRNDVMLARRRVREKEDEEVEVELRRG
jgi:hypothetical protein